MIANRKRRSCFARPIALVALLSCLLLPALPARAQAHGIDAPTAFPAYSGGLFPTQTPGGASSWGAVNAFPALTFRDPIQLIEMPNGQFLIAGKAGELWIIDNDPATTVKTRILDIRDLVLQEPDGGMLGVVLHPEFGQVGSPNNEFLYIWYRYTPVPSHTGQNGYMRLSRFVLSAATGLIDPASEFVMIQQYDRHDWHNGGGMFFGPTDGFLYITVGDEGGAHDNYDSAQKLDAGLFSGVLRIDVDQDPTRSHPIRRQPQEPATPPAGWPGTFSQGYFIPNDNPWLDPGGSILEEFWAIGLRSPHRMAYDPVEDQIWVGDVGQSTREEVTRVERGANMQWPYKEGTINGIQAKPNPLIGYDLPPVYDYPRSVGTCVIGGLVYRGAKYPSLQGQYLFGDHTVRNVWALTPSPGGGAPQVDFLVNIPSGGSGGKNGISSFGTDAAGEIYVLKLFGTDLDGGVIYKLVQTGGVPDPPLLLSQLGLFSDVQTLQPSPGLVPYTVRSPLWSDRAVKGRWIGLPNDGSHDGVEESVGAPAYGEWTFPEGTIFVKHFELPIDERDPQRTRRLETRVMVIDEELRSYGLTYRWNEAETDAELLIDGESADYDVTLLDGSMIQQTWSYPSRSDCLTCHNGNAGWVRGLSHHALNGPWTYPSGVTDNQLRTWSHLGMLRPPVQEADLSRLPAAQPLNLQTYDHGHVVRSYLDSNCAQCHRPNGVNAAFDARMTVPLALQNLVDGPLIGSYGTPDPKVIAPSDPTNSILLQRMASDGPDRMPPLGRDVVHDEAVARLMQWIDGLQPGAPLCDRDALPIPQDGWTLLNATAGTAGNDAAKAFDGNADTHWETPAAQAFPHGITLDLGAVHDLSGLTYLPRQDGQTAGTLVDIEIYTSINGIDWDGPLVAHAFPGSTDREHRLQFSATTRYIGMLTYSEVGGQSITSIAELNFLSAPCLSGCSPAVASIDGLLLDKSGESALLSWAAPTPATGMQFDLLRSDGGPEFVAPTCLERRDVDTAAQDNDLPSVGQTYYYLVRPVDGCLGDVGPLGSASDGNARTAPLCPAP